MLNYLLLFPPGFFFQYLFYIQNLLFINEIYSVAIFCEYGNKDGNQPAFLLKLK